MDLNGAWKSSCRVLFGSEIGELEEYCAYLGEYPKKILTRKSFISGKTVSSAAQHIGENAKFISNSELSEYAALRKAETLGINEMKDVDSLREALGEKISYSGNIVLGNSMEVEGSDRIFNSCFVRASAEIYDSKYSAYSSTARYAECIFGCDNVGQGSKFCIKGHDIYEAVRCFETVRIFTSSDCYYSANLEGCSNCMFSFNLRKSSYRIGNLQLQKDKYLRLKGKLVDEIRSTLAERKSAPTIFEIILGGKHA